MRRWMVFFGILCVLAFAWAWLQSAQVPSGEIDSDDYQPGVTAVGTKLLADLQALETAVNSIDSSQVSSTANIQGSKLLTNSIAYTKLSYRTLGVAGLSWAIETDAMNDTTFDRIMAVGAIDSAVTDTVWANRSLPLRKIQGSVLYINKDPGHSKMAWGKITVAHTTVHAAESTWVKIPYADSCDVGDPEFSSAPRWFLTPVFSGGGVVHYSPVAFVDYYNTADSVSGWLYALGPDSLEGWFEIQWMAVE